MLSSPVEWGIVAAAALLLFGPKKFPEIGRALGQGIGNFKRALTDAQDQVTQGIEEGERGGKDAPKAAKSKKETSSEKAVSEPETKDDAEEKVSSTG